MSAKAAKDRPGLAGSLAKQLSEEASKRLTSALHVEHDDLVFFSAGPAFDPVSSLTWCLRDSLSLSLSVCRRTCAIEIAK